MKKLLLLLCMVSLTASSFAAVHGTWATRLADQPEMAAVNPALMQIDLNEFLSLTPARYKELTGERMTIRETVTLKAAQKMVKKHAKQGEDIPKGLYVVLAIFGWAWLAMGLMDNWEGNNWWVNVILSWILCWLPGVIHAFVKMKDYY